MQLTEVKIAICDDEEDIVSIVKDSVSYFFTSHNITSDISCFSDSQLFSKNLETHSYELVFLDIDMPKIDGINLAKKLHDANSSTNVIFVSNREDRVFDTFQVRPYGFVRKTRFLSEISKVLNQYIIEEEQKSDSVASIIIQSSGQQIKLKIDDIIFIECFKHEQKIHTKNENLVIHDTMSNIEGLTSPYGLKRVHKGFIINLRKVKAIVSDGVVMVDSSFIPINRKKISEFKQDFLNLQQLYGTNILK